jgi:hypothetical protein
MAKEPVQPPKPPAEEPGKPYPVENPPEPHPNEDRPMVDPVPPDKDLPRMQEQPAHKRVAIESDQDDERRDGIVATFHRVTRVESQTGNSANTPVFLRPCVFVHRRTSTLLLDCAHHR